MGRSINNLRYTEDTILIAESSSDLEQLLKRVTEESAKAALQLNNRKPRVRSIEESHTFTANKEPIETVKDFQYLGSVIIPNGDCSQKIRMRLGRAALKGRNLKRLLRVRMYHWRPRLKSASTFL